MPNPGSVFIVETTGGHVTAYVDTLPDHCSSFVCSVVVHTFPVLSQVYNLLDHFSNLSCVQIAGSMEAVEELADSFLKPGLRSYLIFGSEAQKAVHRDRLVQKLWPGKVGFIDFKLWRQYRKQLELPTKKRWWNVQNTNQGEVVWKKPEALSGEKIQETEWGTLCSNSESILHQPKL